MDNNNDNNNEFSNKIVIYLTNFCKASLSNTQIGWYYPVKTQVTPIRHRNIVNVDTRKPDLSFSRKIHKVFKMDKLRQCDVRMAVPKDQVNKNKMAAWGPYGSGVYPPGSEYYSYEYPYGGPYSYDPNAYYSGYYSGYPYGYSYPMPPQPYVAPPRAPVAGGKIAARGRGNAAYHPYTRQQ